MSDRPSDQEQAAIDKAVDRAVAAAKPQQPARPDQPARGPKLGLAVVFAGLDDSTEVLGLVEHEGEGRSVAEAWWVLMRQEAKPAPQGRVLIAPARDGKPDLARAISNFDGTQWCAGADRDDCEEPADGPTTEGLRDRTKGHFDDS